MNNFNERVSLNVNQVPRGAECIKITHRLYASTECEFQVASGSVEVGDKITVDYLSKEHDMWETVFAGEVIECIPMMQPDGSINLEVTATEKI